MNFICFDLEGPLSPQDNAYELMKLIPNGAHIFEILSRYDDLLTLEEREDYEPGDTLALIVPFLVCHRIPETTITELAQSAALVPGAAELISELKNWGWNVFCISTSYEQFASHICRRVGIPLENLACTSLPLAKFQGSAGPADLSLVQKVESDLMHLQPEVHDLKLKERLDRFFWVDLPETVLGAAMKQVKPMGGGRKVKALQGFVSAKDVPLGNTAVVGDSITDFKMLQAANDAGGLAIVFNGNEYALPYATIGLASTHISDLGPVLKAWREDGKEAMETLVRGKESGGGRGDREHFHWLRSRQDIAEPLQIHKRIRRLVREEAGKLG